MRAMSKLRSAVCTAFVLMGPEAALAHHAYVEKAFQSHRQTSRRADLCTTLLPGGEIRLERDGGPFGPSICCPEVFDTSRITLEQRQDGKDGRPWGAPLPSSSELR
jgi:hypothetical protein